jgi:hypothetical protein
MNEQGNYHQRHTFMIRCCTLKRRNCYSSQGQRAVGVAGNFFLKGVVSVDDSNNNVL